MPPELPPTLDLPAYREAWRDLAAMDDKALTAHYTQFGRNEGRTANAIATREAFAALIPGDADALEIGPFFRPMLSGPRVRYFDVLDQAELRDRARQIGLAPDRVPAIDYVSPTGDLGIVTDSFDCALSSHCIEHQPNLVSHLQHVSRLLRQGGRYFLLVPDHRYVFDALIAPSTIAEVLEAHYTDRKVHTLKSVIEHRALTTHNEPSLHWNGEHGGPVDTVERVKGAVREWTEATGGYIDVHAWYFTPDSATELLTTLRAAGYIDLRVERVYPTRRNSNEFWMVLRKPTPGIA